MPPLLVSHTPPLMLVATLVATASASSSAAVPNYQVNDREYACHGDAMDDASNDCNRVLTGHSPAFDTFNPSLLDTAWSISFLYTNALRDDSVDRYFLRFAATPSTSWIRFGIGEDRIWGKQQV